MTRDNGEPLGLVHRDITPENILLASHCAKLADFGIARHEEREFETRTGIVKGKLCYMAPEIFEERIIDGRTDIFSLGLVLAELVLGQPVVPPTAIGVLAIEDLDRHLSTVLSGQSLPADLVELIRCMCAWRSERRPASASMLQSSLKALETNWPADSDEVEWLTSAAANPFESPTVRTEPHMEPPPIPGVFEPEDETEHGLDKAKRRRPR
jgi:serine/threonine-protein kinase